METNLVKQPAPSLSASSSKKEEVEQKTSESTTEKKPKYKITEARNTGVITVPKITKTPITDTIELKRQENPRTVYKLTEKKHKLFSIHTITSLAAIGCGIAAFSTYFKKPMKTFIGILTKPLKAVQNIIKH